MILVIAQLILIPLSLAGPVQADAAGAEIFRFGPEGKAVAFVRDERGLLISSDCSDGKPCGARQACGRASFKKVPESELVGGVHPGAPVCRQAGGAVRIGADSRGNQNSFCAFRDGSWISNGSLLLEARRNDQASSSSRSR